MSGDKRKIRVLHLTSTRYGIGGVERLLLDMADRYDSDRFDVSYCNLFCEREGRGEFPTAIRAAGHRSFTIKGRRSSDVPIMLLKLIDLFRRERFDVVHLHMIKATILGGVAALLSGTKTVVTKHYTKALTSHPAVIKWLDAFFTSRADQAIAISEYVRQDMIAQGISQERITVAMNGTDLVSNVLPTSLEDRQSENNVFTIVSVGSLTERKGHRYLVEAISQVVEHFPKVRLQIIGEGPLRTTLNQLIMTLGLQSNVELLGFRSNVGAHLRACDLYVHPSIHEPFGIAILEAMAAGKCVVASAVEGVPEIVVDGRTGVLVPASDIGELSRAINNRIDDRLGTEDMGRAGLQRVTDLFGIERTVSTYQTVYLSVIGQQANKRALSAYS